MPPTPRSSTAAPTPPPQETQSLPPGQVSDTLEKAAGAAGLVGTVTAAGAVVASVAAIAAAVAKILAAFLSFQKKRNADEMLLLFRTLKREYPQRTDVEIQGLVSKEAEREAKFNAKARARLERDLPKALAIVDPDDRRDKVSRILDREKRYVQMREEQMYARAAARAEHMDVKLASPTGAYWRLDPQKKTHTPGCLMMAAVGFWPWEVLDFMHPQLHAGCGCHLSTREEAEAAGLMHPGQPGPHVPDAIRKARAIAEKTGEISEATADEIALYVAWYLDALQEGVSDEINDLVKSIRKAGYDVCDCGADNLPHEHGKACPAEPAPLHEARWGDHDIQEARKHNAEYERETEKIRERAKLPESKRRHTFEAAKWTHPNGHPRCKKCGQEERIGGVCNGEPTKDEAQAWADRENKDGMWGKSKWTVSKGGKLLLDLQENQEYLALQEARWMRRYPKNDPHGGEFMPHNAVAHIRAEVKKVLRSSMPPPERTPLQERGSKQGRYVWMRGRYVFVPRNRAFTRKLDHVTFHSPVGSTNIYRNGHLVQIEGQGPPPHHHDLNPPHAADIRNIPGTAEYDTGTDEKQDTGTATVEPETMTQDHVDAAFAAMVAAEENRNSLDARVQGALHEQKDAAPPVTIGDYAAAADDVLGVHGFIEREQGVDETGGPWTEYVHPQSAAVVYVYHDEKTGLVSQVLWNPGKPGWDTPHDPMTRPPQNWEEFADEVRGITYRLAHDNDAEPLVGEVLHSTPEHPNTTDGHVKEGHSGSHNSMTGKIILGNDTSDIFDLYERVNASPDSPLMRRRNIDGEVRAGAWASYKVGTHEAIHGVNSLAVGEYQGFGRAVEEALTEELAHVEAAKLVRAHNATQLLEWYRANPEASESLGSYFAYRRQFDRFLNAAGVAVEDREDYMRNLKFKVPSRERYSTMGHALMDGPQKMTPDQADDWLWRNFEIPDGEQLRADAASFVPILRPDLRDFPGPDGVIWKGHKIETNTVVTLDWGKRIEKRDSKGRLRARWVKTKVDASVIKVGQSGVPGQPFKLDVRSLEDGRVFHNVMATQVSGVTGHMRRGETTEAEPFDLNETWILGGDEHGKRVGVGAEVRLRDGAGGKPGRTMRVVGGQFGKILAVDLEGHDAVHDLPNDASQVEVVKEAEERMVRPGDLIRYDGRADGGMSEARVVGTRRILFGTLVDPAAPRYVIEAVTTDDSLKPNTVVQLTDQRMNGMDVLPTRVPHGMPEGTMTAQPVGILSDPGMEGFRLDPKERAEHGVRLSQVRPEHAALVSERFGAPGVGTRRTDAVVPVGTWKRHSLGKVAKGETIRYATPNESETHRVLHVRTEPVTNADGGITVGEHTIPKGTVVSKQHLKSGFFDLLHQIGTERGHDPYGGRDRTYVVYGALDDVRARLRGLTKPERSHVAVRVQPSAFLPVLRSGRIQNGHEENAVLDERHSTDYLADRRAWEKRVFSIPDDAPARDHPVYGYVGTDNEDIDRSGAKGFGTIKVTLRDSVRPRTTMVYSDSNYTGVPNGDAKPVPINEPSEQAVAPWQMRHFLNVEKPVVERGDRPRPFPPFTDAEEWQIQRAGSRFGVSGEEDRLANMEAERRTIARAKGWQPWRHGDFIETQIHGGVHLDTDVAHVTFPPDYQVSDEERQRLDAYSIPWHVEPSEEKADPGSSIEDVARWSDQVRKLANRHDLKWDVSPEWVDAAHASGGAIHTGPITSQADYFTALHEIGHHDVLRDPKELQSAGTNWQARELDREMAAWRFALKNAGEHPNMETRQDIATSLQTYIAVEERLNRRRNDPRDLSAAYAFVHQMVGGNDKSDPGTESAIPYAQRVYIAEGAMKRGGLDGGAMLSRIGHPFHPEPEGRAEADRVSKLAQDISGDPSLRVQITNWIDGPGGTDGHASYDRNSHKISIRPVTDKLTFLHEIAHAMTRTNEGEGHNPEFAKTLHGLYAKHIGTEAARTFATLMDLPGEEKSDPGDGLSFESGATTRPPTRIKIGAGGDIRSFPRQEVVAKDANGAEVGRLDYGHDPDRNILAIGRIDVNADQRRQGIGAELLRRARALHSGATVDPGLIVSKEGQAWWDAMSEGAGTSAVPVRYQAVPRGTKVRIPGGLANEIDMIEGLDSMHTEEDIQDEVGEWQGKAGAEDFYREWVASRATKRADGSRDLTLTPDAARFLDESLLDNSLDIWADNAEAGYNARANRNYMRAAAALQAKLRAGGGDEKADPGPSPIWQRPLAEHQGEYPPSAPGGGWGPGYDAYKQRGREWEQATRHALATGKTTIAEAQARGYHAGPNEREDPYTPGSGWQPLPPALYHVTTAASAVRAQGLRTRAELGQRNGVGLGGGDDDTISFTTDRRLAQHIEDGMREMRSVARGETTIHDLLARASDGDKGSSPFLDSWMKGEGGSRERERLQPGELPISVSLALEGRKQVHSGIPLGGFRYDQAEDVLGPGGRAEGEPVALGNPVETRYVQGSVPMNEMEQRDTAVHLYKSFAGHREMAGGPTDPLFFTSDTEALASTPSDEIETLKFAPRDGGHGFQMGGLREWRTTTGDAVALADPRPYSITPERDPDEKLDPGTEVRPRISVPMDPDGIGLTRKTNDDSKSLAYERWRDSMQKRTGQLVRGDPIAYDDPRVPDTLYHATTNLPGVMADGVLRASGAGGLGGDARDRIVSLTTKPEVASQIAADLHLVGSLGREFGDMPEQTWNDKTKTWGPDRTPYGQRIGAYLREEAERQGFDFHKEYPDRSPEQQEIDRRFRDGMESHQDLGGWINQFFMSRQTQTGVPDPIIFNGTVTAKAINPDHVGVVQVPRANLDTGALLTDFDLERKRGLSEIRVYGDVPVTDLREASPEVTPTGEGEDGVGGFVEPTGAVHALFEVLAVPEEDRARVTAQLLLMEKDERLDFIDDWLLDLGVTADLTELLV